MKRHSLEKTIVVTLMVLMITTVIVQIACNKVEKSDMAYLLPDSLEMPAGMFIPPAIADIVGKKFNGEAVIFYTNNGEILVSFAANQNIGKRPAFILQTEKKASNLAAIKKIDNAQIIYLKDIILINDTRTSKLTLLSINSDDFEKIYRQIPKEVLSRVDMQTSGYGLAYYSDTWENLNEYIDLTGNIYDALHAGTDVHNKMMDEPECDSGGEGSGQCAVSGCLGSPDACSIACSSGFYSCCVCLGGPTWKAKCHCVAG